MALAALVAKCDGSCAVPVLGEMHVCGVLQEG